MAKPRVFVSSTYYDLRYVRSSLELFIQSLGFDAVLSEVGGVAYAPDRALDESCYREVQNCDLYVLIIGGRYGSEISRSRTEAKREFFDRYESVTRTEYRAALEKDIPVYILVERAVHAEYQTFQRNRENNGLKYAHVDSINVFHFIDELLKQPRNNPVQTFDRYAEIENWLREQWAGLFRELLYRMSGQQQLTTLAAQVAELSEVNKTLRRYLEEMLVRVTPEQQGAAIVKDESNRLEEAQLEARLQATPFSQFAVRQGVPATSLRGILADAKSVEDVMERLNESLEGIKLTNIPEGSIGHQNIVQAREVLGLKPLPFRRDTRQHER